MGLARAKSEERRAKSEERRAKSKERRAKSEARRAKREVIGPTHTVGTSVGYSVGDLVVGDSVGDLVGDSVGDFVGDSVGVSVGDAVGLSVGDTVGRSVGDVVGLSVGDTVGLSVGDAVGDSVGNLVGEKVAHFESALQLFPRQSSPMRHFCPTLQGRHAGPPQSTSVSNPFWKESLQEVTVGDFVGVLVGDFVGVNVGGNSHATLLNVPLVPHVTVPPTL
jgi:hypothetical protein